MEKYPLPAALPSATLARDIPARPLERTPSQVEIVCGLFGREWKSQKTPSYVVFLQTKTFKKAAGEDPRPHHDSVRIGLYRQEPDGQYRLAARTAGPFQVPGDADDVDLAPYKLTDGEYAFGLRTRGEFECHEDSYCNGTSSALEVFRVVGTGIRPILSTLMSSAMHTISAANDDGTRDHDTIGDDDSAQISVLKTRTKGVYDWKKKKKRDSAVFKWTGERYELQGEDPVNDLSK